MLSDLNNALKWKGCGHLKLTYHHTFGDLDSLLLIDTDIILLNPVEELFDEMKKFSPKQVLAMATEHPWDNKVLDSKFYFLYSIKFLSNQNLITKSKCFTSR